MSKLRKTRRTERRTPMIDYEISYEMDDNGYCGDLLAFNVRGHGHHPDVIDQFLDAMRTEGYADSGDWEIREDWLRKVPHPDGGSRHTYGTPGRGARAVTVIERSRGWGYWCINHPHEPASVGHSASQVIDGEALVTRRMAELETEIDPRHDVDRRQGMGGYVYMCRECSTGFGERLRAARREALATPIPEPGEVQ